ncbi:MAG: PTS glucitol/sorbitol transporter subunit IIA [Chloroflexi bacterium]|nr:PTS glucitol/sorbitol transporter subunit IIA [Chloroflexota bacterium]
MLKYSAHVIAVGEEVNAFLDHGILVLFGEDAPEELALFAVIHDGKELHAPLEVGDVVWLDEESFRVAAVGEVVNANLGALGHLVLKCNGASEAELPGDLCVEAKPLPQIYVGMPIRIEGDNVSRNSAP